MASCIIDPSLPGCTAVLPLPPAAETPAEIVNTIQSVVVVNLIMEPIPTNAIQPPAPEAAANSDAVSGNNEENKERSPEGVPLTTASQELPLAKQPIFDLSGGGVAGQNMVCK